MSITHESGLNEVRTGDKLLVDAPLPRGQLIRILQRGLLYIEAEQRWRGVDTSIAPPTLSDPLPLPSTIPPVSRESVKAFYTGPPSPAVQPSSRASPPAFLSPPISRQSRAASVTSTDTQLRGKRKERRDSGAAAGGDDSMDVDAPVASTPVAQSPEDVPASKRQRTKTAEVVEAIAAILPPPPVPEPTPSEPPTPASAKASRPSPRAPPTPASLAPTSIRMPSPGGPVVPTLPSPGPSKPRAQIVVKSVIKPAPKPKPQPPAAPLGPPALPESRRSSSPVVTRRVSPVTERKPGRPPAARPKPRASPSEQTPPTPKVKVEATAAPPPSKPRGPSPERYAKPEALTRLRIGTQNVRSSCTDDADIADPIVLVESGCARHAGHGRQRLDAAHL